MPIPDQVPDEQAVFVGDIFMTGYHAAFQGGIRTADTVVIYGCGPIGLTALISARMFGPKEVFSVDMYDNRLALAEHYGATVIDARKEDPVNRILEATDMQGADVAIEAVGNPDTFLQFLNSVRRGGMVSVVGLFPSSVELPLPFSASTGCGSVWDWPALPPWDRSCPSWLPAGWTSPLYAPTPSASRTP